MPELPEVEIVRLSLSKNIIGKKINKVDPIIIIEAMKTFNTIPSTETGIIKNIFVTDGQPIEFGEDIIEIE